MVIDANYWAFAALLSHPKCLVQSSGILLFSYATEHHGNPSRTRRVHDAIEVLRSAVAAACN